MIKNTFDINKTKPSKIVYFGLCTESKYLYDFYETQGFQNTGFFSSKENELVIGNIEAGFECLKTKNKPDMIICCTKKMSSQQINQLIRFCYAKKVKLYLLPNENESYSKNLIPNYIHGIIVFELAPRPINKRMNVFLKRTFDILFSLLVILFILSWLIPILGILIKIKSKGPIFFVQKRNGIHNKEFMCYKFRTMHINSQSDLEQAKEGDKRISKIGKILRKTSIDEFPQFLNVLKGDMSVVGPRPHMIKHNEMYAQLIDDYDNRALVKPGITGLAQVLGYRGETESDIFLMKIRVRMDIFYINNWSLFLDLKIVLKTITNVIFKNKNAF